jgi:hypothetical protein
MPRPHVCAALQHLRLGVTISAATLAVCILINLLVWAFVHFTDVRWRSVEPGEAQRLSVVVGGEAPATTGRPETDRIGPDANRVPSLADGNLRVTTNLVTAAGIVSAVLLTLCMRQGVSIAAGVSAPGLQKMVGAATWTVVAAMMCLPLREWIAGYPLAPILPGYDGMTRASEALRAGEVGALGYFGVSLAAPLVTLVALTLLTLRYSAGVEEGIIATSPVDLDAKLDREMASMKLSAQATARAVGALNRAVGDAPVPAGRGTDAVDRLLDEPSGRRLTEPSPGKPMSRPI